ncbi:Slp family lipoprotein [Aeromonas schubertii]|uniref:Slp family lipoprotein n=1 Tax=Aeromonas schubertii TaxID=652 RepID=A0ABS7VDL8_9GAMM|nr:Slp family lipoprotein [Aeromonas schubertii]KUE81590.1 hypothetical protein ATO46_01235 [Aeromonas schubertii]MBZ6067474.1 Slp family lipoprotein [Aeromonas schubertii]MBZ6071740.1 Slp family lipoprotein [Aeromonas schubertii]QCG48561.1 Slp family lipoprotein [Aeromonas schubertii]
MGYSSKPWSRLLLGAATLLLAACGTVPRELAYEPESALVPFKPALEQSGAMARWSGVIAEVRNEPSRSVLEVVELPLKSNGVPQQTEQSAGRFLAIMPGFVDPTLYAKGRSLSVLGKVAAPVDGKIGEHPYRFAVLEVDKSKLWPPVKEVEVRYVDPFFYDPFYDPFWPRRSIHALPR